VPQAADPSNRRHPLPRPGRGSPSMRRAEILRVDHAGEYAAVQIYRAQAAVFRAGRPELSADMSRMQAQEAVHLARFETLVTEGRVRPTLLLPAWRLAAQALGAGTALLGEKAAHACTEAVETVIAEHYNDQIAEVSVRDPALAEELTVFRDEEIEHHDHAVEQGAREAPGYRLLSAVIRTGCRAAIKLSERI
jgi:ubiquinone biosynthesis monooxygenase Coq7